MLRSKSIAKTEFNSLIDFKTIYRFRLEKKGKKLLHGFVPFLLLRKMLSFQPISFSYYFTNCKTKPGKQAASLIASIFKLQTIVPQINFDHF